MFKLDLRSLRKYMVTHFIIIGTTIYGILEISRGLAVLVMVPDRRVHSRF